MTIQQSLALTPTWALYVATLLAVTAIASLGTRWLTPAVLIVPGIGVPLWSAWSVATQFPRTSAAMFAWSVAIAAAKPAFDLLQRSRGNSRYDPYSRRIVVPGSRTPMALIALIFVARWSIEVGLGAHPSWADASDFAMTAGFWNGLPAGLALARSLQALQLVSSAPTMAQSRAAPCRWQRTFALS